MVIQNCFFNFYVHFPVSFRSDIDAPSFAKETLRVSNDTLVYGDRKFDYETFSTGDL